MLKGEDDGFEVRRYRFAVAGLRENFVYIIDV
jgi:hypothetical protein